MEYLLLLFFMTSSVLRVEGGCDCGYSTLDDLPFRFYSVYAPWESGTTHVLQGNSVVLRGTPSKQIGSYKFRGNIYQRMTINRNGNVQFGDGVVSPDAPEENVHVKTDMAAAFWADSQQATCGSPSNVYYRHSQHKRDRRWFKKIIRRTKSEKFNPEDVVVVTYFNMQSALGGSAVNSYQIVIGTGFDMEANDIKTYVIFIYGDMCWTDPGNSMAGFTQKQKGDRYMYRKSFTADISNLPDDGFPDISVYAFRVDVWAPKRHTNWFIEDWNPVKTGYVHDYA